MHRFISHIMSYRCFSTKLRNSLDKHLTNLIEKHTCVSRDSLTPEIALNLITPSSPLWNLPIENVPFRDPFWAFYWPGGQAIARFILDNPNVVSGQSVLDLGSGCGACAIAAAMRDADSVVANDIDKVAVAAISLNCILNNVKVTTNSEQLVGSQEVKEDCLLIGDMFYDEIFADTLMKWLENSRSKGKNIYIGDPGRMCFTKFKTQFQCLAEYPVDNDLNPGFSSVSLWKMK